MSANLNIDPIKNKPAKKETALKTQMDSKIKLKARQIRLARSSLSENNSPPPPPRFFPLLNQLFKRQVRIGFSLCSLNWIVPWIVPAKWTICLANYLNIKDRSNSAFNPRLTPLHTGFSLIEVLITATIGLILGAGVLKLSQIAIENTHILKTIFAEQKLEKAVSDALSDQAHCKDILGPFHSKTARPISVTNDSSKDYTYGVKTGEFEGGLIDIQKIELNPPNPLDSANTEADYIVYFKKPRLGKYATLGGGKCTSGTTAGDQAGCYFVKCKMDYFCSDNACGGTSDQCRLKTCEGNTQAPGVANKKCEAGKVLIGFNSAGQTICCRPGEEWDETSSPPQCKCPNGKTWNGHACSCRKNQKLAKDGTCVDACFGQDNIKIWDGKKCVCPYTTWEDVQGRCQCGYTAHRPWRSITIPELPGFTRPPPYWSSEYEMCICPDGWFFSTTSGCSTCPGGSVRRAPLAPENNISQPLNPSQIPRGGNFTGPYDVCACWSTDDGFESWNGHHCCHALDTYDHRTRSCWQAHPFRR